MKRFEGRRPDTLGSGGRVDRALGAADTAPRTRGPDVGVEPAGSPPSQGRSTDSGAGGAGAGGGGGGGPSDRPRRASRSRVVVRRRMRGRSARRARRRGRGRGGGRGRAAGASAGGGARLLRAARRRRRRPRRARRVSVLRSVLEDGSATAEAGCATSSRSSWRASSPLPQVRRLIWAGGRRATIFRRDGVTPRSNGARAVSRPLLARRRCRAGSGGRRGRGSSSADTLLCTIEMSVRPGRWRCLCISGLFDRL